MLHKPKLLVSAYRQRHGLKQAGMDHITCVPDDRSVVCRHACAYLRAVANMSINRRTQDSICLSLCLCVTVSLRLSFRRSVSVSISISVAVSVSLSLRLCLPVRVCVRAFVRVTYVPLLASTPVVTRVDLLLSRKCFALSCSISEI